ncbi:hypothetical protein SLE2022_095130 [Rubroshorea leprosula]
MAVWLKKWIGELEEKDKGRWRQSYREARPLFRVSDEKPGVERILGRNGLVGFRSEGRGFKFKDLYGSWKSYGNYQLE